MFQKYVSTIPKYENVFKYARRCLSCKLKDEDRIFANLYGRHDWHLDSAMCRGDWFKTKEIIMKGSEWIVNELEKSGVKGRGGGSFPLAEKLKMMLKVKLVPPRYVVVNGAEGEPGSCKDREIMRHEPQKIIEGALLIGRAVCATEARIFVRGRFYREACNLQMALAEAYEAGLVGKNACGSDFNFDITIQRGAGRYISGEETALLNCLMGNEARPRKKPPYPAVKGLFNHSTLILNTETVSVVPTICRRGHKWFSKLGVGPHSCGSRLFNISGCVERPCTVEESLGISLREIIETHAGGVKGGWDNLMAVYPGGSSSPMLNKALCDKVTLDIESIEAAESHLGTGAIIVIDKSHDLLEAVSRILHFLKKGSCHQCSRCRGQSTWAFQICDQFRLGHGHPQEIDFLTELTKWAPGHTICNFSLGNAWAMQGLIRHFRGLIEKRIQPQVRP